MSFTTFLSSMDFSSIPSISISLAPPEETSIEPPSPFCWAPVNSSSDGFRLVHLTQPPGRSHPLRPIESVVTGKGLERERFETLLKASRERNASMGAKKVQDLRRQIALKTHQTKQVERRALFLSKVLAPPSPTATSLPKTPPESPAIFHYSLPSPGLVSPLALFESLANEDFTRGPVVYREPWVEQVDFRVPNNSWKSTYRVSDINATSYNVKPSKLPSLDQITARLSFQGLASLGYVQSQQFNHANDSSIVTQRPRLVIGVGRLKMPLPAPKSAKRGSLRVVPHGPPSPPLTSHVQITTLVVPRSSTTSQVEPSELNILAMNSRARRSHDMLSTIQRRIIPSERVGNRSDVAGRYRTTFDRNTKWKRQSAPAEFQQSIRSGFEHHVLSLPGGF